MSGLKKICLNVRLGLGDQLLKSLLIGDVRSEKYLTHKFYAVSHLVVEAFHLRIEARNSSARLKICYTGSESDAARSCINLI